MVAQATDRTTPVVFVVGVLILVIADCLGLLS